MKVPVVESIVGTFNKDKALVRLEAFSVHCETSRRSVASSGWHHLSGGAGAAAEDLVAALRVGPEHQLPARLAAGVGGGVRPGRRDHEGAGRPLGGQRAIRSAPVPQDVGAQGVQARWGP